MNQSKNPVKIDKVMGILLVLLFFIVGVSIGQQLLILKQGHAESLFLGAFASPSITIDNPQDGSYFKTPLVYLSGKITGTINSDNVEIILDGNEINYVWASISGNDWSYTLTNISTGQHKITTKLIDQTGNYTNSVIVNIVTSGQTSINKKVIALDLSELCTNALKGNGPTDCPKYKDLIPFDTSNQKISGKFIKDKAGKWYRTLPQVRNHDLWYSNYNYTVVCYDCRFDRFNADLQPSIIIEPHGFKYASSESVNTIVSSNSSSSNSTLVINELESTATINFDRFVSPDCMSANLPFDKNLLADTIDYMSSGCVKTKYNMTSTIKVPNNPVDPTKSAEWVYQHQLKINLKTTLNNCINYKCNIPDDRWK